ncbi:MAG: hypothetical protein JW818_15845 [Pirellulales bacterium]|nr:hypothetical protein [Pirellulales bacterium]
MRKRHSDRWTWLAGLAVAWLAAAGPAVAVEQWKPFIERLREHGMADMVPVYLEQIQASPLCPRELRDAFDYEMGCALIDSSRRMGSVSAQTEALGEAQSHLNNFIKRRPKHPRVADARSQLALLLVDLGQSKVRQADRPSTLPADKPKLQAKGRAYFTQAEKVLGELEKHYVAVLKEMPRGKLGPKETELEEARNRARDGLTQTRLSMALLAYDKAMLWPAKSRQRKSLLEKAAKELAEQYEKYEDLKVGQRARLAQARCYFALGRHTKALEILDELLEHKDSALRDLQEQALALGMEIACLPKVARYDEAVKTYQKWEQTSDRHDHGPTPSTIRYFAGIAYVEAARKLKESDPNRARLRSAGRKIFKELSRYTSVYQQEGREKLVEYFGKGSEAETGPTTFAEARQEAQDALDQMQAAEVQVKLAQKQGKTAQRKKYEKEAADQRAEAKRLFRDSLALVTPDTSKDDINLVRYYLAYLHWLEEDEYGAAVLGEFLAQRYPNCSGARQGARFALIGYSNLYSQADNDAGRQFAYECLIRLADLLSQRWPDEAEAADTWTTLIKIASLRSDLAAARGYLKRLSPNSPGHGKGMLLVGQAVWSAYIQAQQDTAPSNSTQPDSANKALLDEAQRLLAQGLARVAKDGDVDRTVFAAALSLAQIYLREDKPAEAAKLIEAPRVGLLTLVRANDPAAEGKGLALETYKVALRAFVAVGQLNKAEEVMNALDKLAKDEKDPQAEAQITRVYLSVGQCLRQQLEELGKQNKPERQEAMRKGIEQFLDRVAARTEGNTYNSLRWVAQTYVALGTDLAAAESGSKQAEPFFQKAAGVYETILKRMDADKKFAPDSARVGVQIGLARCQRHLGKFREAIVQLAAILKTRNRMVDVQVEAAETLQAWAGTKGEGKKYLLAIRGGVSTKLEGREVNLIWGWGKIAATVARLPKYEDLFHQARYNMALCRYRYALTLPQDDRPAVLRQAEKDITVIQILRPKMGGPKWQPKYDALLKTIQRRLGEKPVGLGPAK